MKKLSLLFLTIITSSLTLLGQENTITINLSSDYVFNQSIHSSYFSSSGFSLILNKTVYTKSNYNTKMGLRTGINSPTFYSAFDFSVGRNFSISRFKLDTYLGTYQGVELFKPKPLFLTGYYSHIELFNLLNKNHLGAYLELNYYLIPAYKKYALHNQFWGPNIGFSWHF